MDRLDDAHLAELFAAGVLSSFREAGGTEKDAEAFLEGCIEKTARRRHYDDEDETWWSRNKKWVIPALVGTGAFLIGGDAGKYGRRDRSLWTNAASQFWRRLQTLFGISDDPVLTSMTQAPGWNPKTHGYQTPSEAAMTEVKMMKDKFEYHPPTDHN